MNLNSKEISSFYKNVNGLKLSEPIGTQFVFSNNFMYLQQVFQLFMELK